MKKYLYILLVLICLKSVSYCQMYSLCGVNLLTTPNESRSLFKTFALDKSDYLSRTYIGVNYDNVILHLSYTNTNTEDTIDNDENYKLTGIDRIYNNSSLEEWAKKVYLFKLYFKVEPKISVVEDLTLRVASWKFVQTNTIFNVIYNGSKGITSEMLFYALYQLNPND